MKRFLAILLTTVFLCSALAFVGCQPTEPEEPTVKLKLATPKDVAVSQSGLVTWTAVENATSYRLSLNNDAVSVTGTEYQLTSLVNDVLISVCAVADGYEDSDVSHTVRFRGRGVTPIIPTNTLAVEGVSSVRSGREITFTATLNGEPTTDVSWDIVNGAEFAQIDANGKLKANSVDGDKIVTVRATSNADSSVYADKGVSILGAPALTQAMLDEYANEARLAFDGFITISYYNVGLTNTLAGTQTLIVKTRMDADGNWYASYENASAAVESELFYKNVDGVASQAVLNYMNQASYYPLTDENGDETAWADAGLYNNFVGLTTKDFRFDEESWRWQYVGGDSTFTEKMVASSNPFNFVVDQNSPVSLLIDDGHIVGLYVKSGADYSISSQYEAYQELFVAISYGNSVEVPTITAFNFDERQAPLAEALGNMRALTSYTMDFRQIVATQYTSTPTQTGYDEIITQKDCYFRDYTFGYDDEGNLVKKYSTEMVNGNDEPQDVYYGFHKYSDTLYNSYQAVGSVITPSRAYNKHIDTAKPSFEFAAELFTSFTEEQEDGSVTYYVNEAMCSVAQLFYYGMGNDIALYGMYASSGLIEGSTFTPYVVVKDGYIVEAAFYFFLGTIYGYVYITYDNFNAVGGDNDVAIPQQALTALERSEPRLVPTAWEQLTVIVSGDSTDTTTDDYEVPADEFFKEFLGDDGYAILPFFGDAIGDTYGFSLTTYQHRGGESVSRKCLQMYYDVPLDIDYSITSSLNALYKQLADNGFTANKYGEYQKKNVVVYPVDSSLDLFIYVWNVAA